MVWGLSQVCKLWLMVNMGMLHLGHTLKKSSFWSIIVVLYLKKECATCHLGTIV